MVVVEAAMWLWWWCIVFINSLNKDILIKLLERYDTYFPEFVETLPEMSTETEDELELPPSIGAINSKFLTALLWLPFGVNTI